MSVDLTGPAVFLYDEAACGWAPNGRAVVDAAPKYDPDWLGPHLCGRDADFTAASVYDAGHGFRFGLCAEHLAERQSARPDLFRDVQSA